LTYFGVLLMGSAVAAALWSRAWRRAHSGASIPSLSARLFDLGLLAWGAAALVAAVGAPERASELLDGNAFGSEVPAATLIGWLPIAFLAGAILSHPKVIGVVKRKPWLLSLVTVAVILVLGEGIARAWTVIKPE